MLHQTFNCSGRDGVQKKKKKLYPKFRLGIDAKDVTVSESKQVTAYLLVWMWPSAKRNFYIPENTTNVILTKVFSFFFNFFIITL